MTTDIVCVNVWKPNTTHSRDAQIIFDLAMNITCMALPLVFLWFGYFVPISVGENLSLLGYPTLSTVMKLDELMEENVRSRLNKAIISRQRSASMSLGRDRLDIFRRTILEETAELQGSMLHDTYKRGFSALTTLSAVYFLVVGITVVSLSPSCNTSLWDKCLVKVPLCQF